MIPTLEEARNAERVLSNSPCRGVEDNTAERKPLSYSDIVRKSICLSQGAINESAPVPVQFSNKVSILPATMQISKVSKEKNNTTLAALAVGSSKIVASAHSLTHNKKKKRRN